LLRGEWAPSTKLLQIYTNTDYILSCRFLRLDPTHQGSNRVPTKFLGTSGCRAPCCGSRRGK
jgi:hypothetical protein